MRGKSFAGHHTVHDTMILYLYLRHIFGTRRSLDGEIETSSVGTPLNEAVPSGTSIC